VQVLCVEKSEAWVRVCRYCVEKSGAWVECVAMAEGKGRSALASCKER